jgi:hypothetical protein
VDQLESVGAHSENDEGLPRFPPVISAALLVVL